MGAPAERALALLLAAMIVCVTSAALADAGTEKEVATLQRKAIQEDFLNLDFPSAIKLLQSAIVKCGADKCGNPVRGSLLRDLGAMQILGGAVEEGKANFALAVASDPSLELDAAYKNARLDAAWAVAKGAAPSDHAEPPATPGPAPTAGPTASAAPDTKGRLPSGDFKHVPAAAQAVRTPLPVYVEYAGSSTLKRVLVKYKAPGMAEWAPVDLQRMGEDGWGGLVPCKDVTQGNVEYFIQGFDAENDPVATSGSRTEPYRVPVQPAIPGPEPSLPGQDPPKQCSELVGVECPPNFPGCSSEKKPAGEDCQKGGECASGSCVGGKCEERKDGGEECQNNGECASGACTEGKCDGPSAQSAYHKIWGGVGIAIDVLVASGADDVCALNGSGTGTFTSGSPYLCYDPNLNAGFPGSGALNHSIDTLSTTRLDYVNGGLARGPVTLFASVDYALNPNVLIGARVGYELLTYPGSNPGPAFPPLRIEGRVSYLLGTNAINQFFAPVFIGALGAGEFDAFVPVKVTLVNPPTGAGYQAGVVQEDAWFTAGPVYAALGGGVRLAFGGEKKDIALTGVLKLETAFGGTSGFLFGFAPELAVAYGF